MIVFSRNISLFCCVYIMIACSFQYRIPFPSRLNQIYQGLSDNHDQSFVSSSDKVKALRRMLTSSENIILMPCCYDGLTATLVEKAGFNLTFMTGFGVSATYGLPDTGLVSLGEMVDSANVICNSLKKIPCIGDGDTVRNLMTVLIKRINMKTLLDFRSGCICIAHLYEYVIIGIWESCKCEKNY